VQSQRQFRAARIESNTCPQGHEPVFREAGHCQNCAKRSVRIGQVGCQGERSLDLGESALPITSIMQHRSEACMCVCIRSVEGDCPIG
jgi:hypothetical protein